MFSFYKHADDFSEKESCDFYFNQCCLSPNLLLRVFCLLNKKSKKRSNLIIFLKHAAKKKTTSHLSHLEKL